MSWRLGLTSALAFCAGAVHAQENAQEIALPPITVSADANSNTAK